VSSAQCDCQLFEPGKHCEGQVFHQMDSMRHHMVHTGQRERSLWGESDHVTAACNKHTVALKICGLFGFASELFTSKCVQYAYGLSNSVYYQGCINGLLLATINIIFVKRVKHKIRASKVSKNWVCALLGGSLKIRHLCMTSGCFRIQITQ